MNETQPSSWTKNTLTFFDITASTSVVEQIISEQKEREHQRWFHLFPSERAVQRPCQKGQTCTAQMENDYSCQVCSVNVTVLSSFELWMRWCVAIMASEQWPQGSRDRRGKVISYQGAVGAEIGPSPSSDSERLVLSLAMPGRDRCSSNEQLVLRATGQKDGQEKGTRVCSTSAWVENLAHLESKSEFIEKLQLHRKNIFWNQSHSMK